MSGHTPTPWVVGAHFAERQGARTYIPILRPGNDPVPLAAVHRDVDGYGRGEGEGNAAFIVRAVNSHADLIKALQFIADGYANQDVDYRVKVYQVALDALEKAGAV